MQRVRAAFQLRLAEVLTQEHRLQCRATATHTDVLKVRLLQGERSPQNRLQGHQGLQEDNCRSWSAGPGIQVAAHPQVLLTFISFATSLHRMGSCLGFEWPISGSHRS